MKKHIKFKHIIVGCMMAAILAVPVMAFAAPNASDAAAADTPAVTEQAPDIPDAAPADDVQAEAPTAGDAEQPTEADGNTALDPAVGGETGETGDTDTDVQPADSETTDDTAASGSSTPVYYYIVGGCVVALGVGFYIALSLKQKRR